MNKTHIGKLLLLSGVGLSTGDDLMSGGLYTNATSPLYKFNQMIPGGFGIGTVLSVAGVILFFF